MSVFCFHGIAGRGCIFFQLLWLVRQQFQCGIAQLKVIGTIFRITQPRLLSPINGLQESFQCERIDSKLSKTKNPEKFLEILSFYLRTIKAATEY